MSRKSYDTPKRHSIIKVRLTEKEKSDFAKVCKILGMTQSEVIRRAIRGVTIKIIVVNKYCNVEDWRNFQQLQHFNFEMQ